MLPETHLNSHQQSTHPYCGIYTMSIKTKLFTSAIVLCASGVLAANIFASPSNNNQSLKNPELQELAQYNQNDRNNNNRPNNQSDHNSNNRSNNQNGRNNNNNRPRFFSRLPNGYRRVISHNKTYYTQDNQAYYSYSSASDAYVLINLPGISISF